MSGKYNKAGKCALMAVKKFPQYARAYMVAGLAFSDLKNPKAAINYINYSLKLDPKLLHAHNNLGYIYYEMKMNKKAAAEYYKEIELYPENPNPYYNLNTLYQDLKMDNEAEKILLKGIEKVNSGALHGQLAKIYNKRGNTTKAYLECKQAVELSPYDPEAYYQLGIICIKKGELEVAMEVHKALNILDKDMAAKLLKKIKAAQEE
jgi:Flp pilus assembly protein TadD